MSNKKPKIIVILGTTASGKTALGVDLALRLNGEIVSADSRQVYRGMDIGTGKDLDEYRVRITNDGEQKTVEEKNDEKLEIGNWKFVNVRHHLIDVVDPNDDFSLADYMGLAYRAIDDILERHKLPIIVGGSGLYLQAIVDGYSLPGAKPDKKLREKLEEKSVSELFEELGKINPNFAKKLNESDHKNKRHLIRYVEIARAKTGTDFSRINKDPEDATGSSKKYEALLLGLTNPREVLHDRIHKRLLERLENEDMVGEVDRLHESGVSWKLLESFGLEYKYIALYLQEKIDYDIMVEQLFTAIKKFAKRQLTWFRRWERQGAKIDWLDERSESERKIKDFIKK